MHPARAEVGLVRLGDSDFVPASPEVDLRGRAVCDAQGRRIGGVEDLYIVDRQERAARFLEVGAGGFLGIGEKVEGPRDDYTSLPRGGAEETADQRRNVHSSFPYGSWPH